MASFTTYGKTFTFPDRYATGHAVTENEAAVLNQQMAEMISHRIRSGPFAPLAKGDSPTDEQLAEANALVEKLATEFVFGAGRAVGEPRVTDPLEVEARSIAREQILAKIKAAGYAKVGKKAVPERTKDDVTTPAVPEEEGEGIYPYSKYLEKVALAAQHPAIVAKAKKALAARAGAGEVEIEV
ncbi:MAG TPA: hypothetical protein VLA89_09290 [Gemmatimonadales bacterium]|nr:hypothetical protein [Gemmatimonadales bacterium]